MRNIEKMNNVKTWLFFENLRNFANLLIFKFDNSLHLNHNLKVIGQKWPVKLIQDYLTLIIVGKMMERKVLIE